MAKYLIVGAHRIDGVEPGEIIEIDDDDVAARLEAGGHIEPASKTRTKKPSEADAADSREDDS